MRSGSMFVKIFSAMVAALMLAASPVMLYANTSSPQIAYSPNNSYKAAGHDKRADELLSAYQKNHPGAHKF